MDKISNYWFKVISIIVFACFMGIFYPTISPATALFSGAITEIVLNILFHILNQATEEP